MKDSKIKRPSIKGMSNVSYLGRFQKDKFIQDGHNTSVRPGGQYSGDYRPEMMGVQGYANSVTAGDGQQVWPTPRNQILSKGASSLVTRLRNSRLRKSKRGSPTGNGGTPGSGGIF